MPNALDAPTTGPAGFGVIAERFRRAGQPERAVALCREGLEKFPEHLSARVTLGWSLLDMGEHREAFDQLKSVIKRAPDNLAAIRGLAELHERGIGLELDSMAGFDSEEPEDVARDVTPDVGPGVVPLVVPMEELDPVLDPVFEPISMAAVEEIDPVVEPVVEPARFEIEDVIDEFDDAEIEQAPVSLFERAPLALRDAADVDRVDALRAWLHRVRTRRSETMTEYMAS